MARPSVNILTQFSYFIFGAGDDEHSDYFHEGGSGCDLVNTMLSTSDDVARPNGAVDPSLDAILRGSFQQDMTKTCKDAEALQKQLQDHFAAGKVMFAHEILTT